MLCWGAVTSVAGVRGARGVSILSTRFVNLSTSFYVITVFMLPFRKILNDTLQTTFAMRDTISDTFL